MKIAFFGHRQIDINENLISILKTYIENLVKQGFSTFYFGGFGEFDDLCYKIVCNLKLKYPYLRRIFCLTDRRYLNEQKRPAYLKNENYEEFVYFELDFDYWYKRIYFRNCEIVKNSDFIIFYVQNLEYSGANKTLSFAKKLKKDYVNIVDVLK